MHCKGPAFGGTAVLLVSIAAITFMASQPAASPRGEVPVAFADALQLKNAVFLRGDRGIIAAGTSTFVWCEEGANAGAAINIPSGNTQIYEFRGYEYALLSIGALTFPGTRTVIENGVPIESDVHSLRPRVLYHVFSTEELSLDCAKGLGIKNPKR